MTHSHDTPPTPDALAQVLTPEERRCVERWRRDDSRAEAYLLPIIERLAGKVARLRQWKEDREYSDADERARLREID